MALHKMAITPENAGYAIEPGQEALYVALQGGQGRYRQDILGASSKASVTWIVGPTDYRYLEAFYNTHKGGSKAFLINLIFHTQALTEYQAHIIPGSWKVSDIEGQKYTVSATLEITPTTPVNYTSEEALVTARDT